MRTFLPFLVLFVGTAACSAAQTSSTEFAGDPAGGGPGAFGGASNGANGDADSGALAQPGTLTAGAWDDNRNYDVFTDYLSKHVPQKIPFAHDPQTTAEDAAHLLFAGDRTAKALLDVAIVIDTTGSMGDEISYLRTEFQAIASAVGARFPGAQPRWSLVAYKDVGDEYLAKPFAFTANPADTQAALGTLSAGGGGDYEESPEEGFKALNQLQWRSGADVAKLAFWIADAPQHPWRTQAFADAIDASRALGVHVYPIAASGADEQTEVSMRSAAQVTGGRYLFLTDDSGVGGTHKEPQVPCFFVTKLDRAVARTVAIEMTGTYEEPAPADIIRTGGDPKNGRCLLGNGTQVDVF